MKNEMELKKGLFYCPHWFDANFELLSVSEKTDWLAPSQFVRVDFFSHMLGATSYEKSLGT